MNKQVEEGGIDLAKRAGVTLGVMVLAYLTVTVVFTWRGGSVSLSPLDAISRDGVVRYFNDVFFYLGALGTTAMLLLCVVDGGVRQQVSRLFAELLEGTLDFKRFCVRNKGLVVFAVIVCIAAYGFEISNFILSLDEEWQMTNAPAFEGWADEGRFGIGILKRVFMNFGMYPPFLANFAAVLLLMVAGLMFVYLQEKATHHLDLGALELEESRSNALYNAACSTATFEKALAFSLFVCFTPTWVEVLSFSTYAIEIALGMTSVVLATVFFSRYLSSGSIHAAIWCAVLYVLSFSIYQAFVPVSAALIVIYFVSSSRSSAQSYIKALGILFISSALYGIMYLIGRIVQSNAGSDAYLAEMTGISGSGGIFDALSNSVASLRELVTNAAAVPGVECLGLIIVFGVAALIVSMLKGFNGCAWVERLLLIILTLIPFAMWIGLCSTQMPLRSFLAAPPVFSYLACYVVRTLRTGPGALKPALWVLAAILVILLGNQLQNINRIFVSESIRAESDIDTARQIVQEIEEKTGGRIDCPIVFVGAYDTTQNNSYIIHYPQTDLYWGGDVVGYSIWRRAGEPNRMRGLFMLAGYELSFRVPTDAEIVKAQQTLNPWPDEDSILVTENAIIVRLS